MKHHAAWAGILALLTTILLPSPNAAAQGTAFTYQGRLNNNGSPANGNYDLTFSLFANSAGGVAFAGPVTNTAVVVTNGLFTTLVDFGSRVFTGSSNWLGIAVSTNSANAFSTLAPRQQLAPTPYALFANAANTLLGTLPAVQLSGNIPAADISGGLIQAQLPTNVAFLDANQTFTGQNSFSANVGLGTSTPDRPLAITGTGSNGGNGEWISLQDTNGVTRWHLNNFFNGLNFAQSGIADFRLFLSTNGDVGIGMSSPGSALDVAGDIHASGTFTGDGSGLINLNAASLMGTIPLADLSEVALLNGGNFFEGNQIITNGNVGIGTTTPATALQVNGTVTATAFTGNGGGLTNLVQASVTSAQNLRIVQGIVTPSGTAYEGTGFTVTSNSVGNYTITFTPGFSNLPATTFSGASCIATWNFLSQSTVQVSVVTYAGTPINQYFSFIAIGTR